jgi:hypothetical protein
MKEVLNRLQRIAKANNDKFGFKIELIANAKTVFYQFECFEQYEDHTFIFIETETFEEIPLLIEAEIEDACKEWNYKLVH